MTVEELFHAGNLFAAIEQSNNEVKTHPADTRLRSFLFYLLCFAGDYQRAERQLDVIAHQDTTAEIGAQVYRNILIAEQARWQLFSHGLPPKFLADPPPYARLHLEAITQLRENKPVKARSLLEEAAEVWPQLTGEVNGQPFSDLQDADAFFGPFLEVITQDTYVWLPFEQIHHLQIPLPKTPSDLLWPQVTIEMRDGVQGEMFVPVLYTGSSDHADERVKLGRMTDWRDVGEELARGMGQHLFLVDGEEKALLEIREIKFDIRAAESET